MNQTLLGALRREAREAPESGIVEVMNYGRERPGMIPLWAGEGDLPTPDFICQAAARSLAAGETFYTWQRGIPELRRALAAYHERQFGRSFEHERFYVTGSGMQAIQIAIAAVAGTGDEVIVPTPAWPNFAAALGVAGGTPRFVPITLSGSRWSLDLDAVAAAINEKTRAIFINSPSNPTGWTATEEDLRFLLALARRHGLWIVADEVYNRFVYGRERAPSFYDVMSEGDRILFVNTFSKNWAMTGWRIGWIAAPESLGPVLENLIQYSTSGVAAFMQRAAVAALEEGEWFVREQVARAAEGRQIVCGALEGSNRVRFAWPDGAFYLFFAITDEPDTSRLGLRLVDEANIGLAPGTAFGPGGEPYMRICFARRADDMREAARRLSSWLAR
ncbi:pyridoxal phosphate-dependent aminotransferase [Propylenella binzhouense]|uniref:aspartate transaminase n=1 Tax=Propylenella binzhouense TaxID=2555902 RepID=A0A964T142_9HYPH|nr:pyridoxal phosphate-dependent aminotransferase [Propylenella binzhouense]MYZ46380.1 pyridoxal phosphate-dependent aminotransferase [Propylenella binzhouense]